MPDRLASGNPLSQNYRPPKMAPQLILFEMPKLLIRPDPEFAR